MQCPGGQFALEGDTACRDCLDAISYGFAASSCILWAAQKKRVDDIAASGYSYARIVAQPQPPGAIASDWYGQNAPGSFSWGHCDSCGWGRIYACSPPDGSDILSEHPTDQFRNMKT